MWPAHHRQDEHDSAQPAESEDGNAVAPPVGQTTGPRPRRGCLSRRRSSGVLDDERRERRFGGGRHRRFDAGVSVSWFQSELFDEVIEVEQSRRVERRLLDGAARLRLRRRQHPGLVLDVAAAVPADRQLPVFERLLTVRTTLHDSSRTASPPRAWMGQCPCRQRRGVDCQCRRGAEIRLRLSAERRSAQRDHRSVTRCRFRRRQRL